jgi:hypothetical protein
MNVKTIHPVQVLNINCLLALLGAGGCSTCFAVEEQQQLARQTQCSPAP